MSKGNNIAESTFAYENSVSFFKKTWESNKYAQTEYGKMINYDLIGAWMFPVDKYLFQGNSKYASMDVVQLFVLLTLSIIFPQGYDLW